MSGALPFKVYRADGELVAECRYAEDAAAVVGSAPEGSTVRVRRRVVWREGSEDFGASESYDQAAAAMWARASGLIG